MKLYYLIISIFCTRLFGFYNFVFLLFFINFTLHLLDRLPIFINENQNNNLLKNVNNKYIWISNKFKYYNNFNNIHTKIISSKFYILTIKLYNKVEYVYLILLDEILLMLGNIAVKVSKKVISNKFKSNDINFGDYDLVAESSTEEETEEENEVNNLLNKIKKKSNIKTIREKKNSMSASDLNYLYNIISSLTGTLNTLESNIDKYKDKEI